MSKSKEFSPPASLKSYHGIEGFRSGEESLDSWLHERAIENMEMGASRTYVVCQPDSHKVVGYYAVCMGHILGNEVTGSMRRNMPRQIPAVILGRLAVDKDWQGRGLGKALLNDAVRRATLASAEVSARLLIVHVISKEAEIFYEYYGFVRLPTETPTYALDLVKFASPSK